jgi:hypothetical protein
MRQKKLVNIISNVFCPLGGHQHPPESSQGPASIPLPSLHVHPYAVCRPSAQKVQSTELEVSNLLGLELVVSVLYCTVYKHFMA